MDAEHLSDLIGDIYDAALDPALWQPTLSKCSAFTQGVGASVYYKDLDRNAFSVVYHDGANDLAYAQSYGTTYIKIDPSHHAHFFLQIGEVVGAYDLMPYQEFVETRFYKEWVAPQGFVDTANVLLERSANRAILFIVFRLAKHGLLDDETRRRVRLLAPHIRRAALIGDTLEQKTATGSMFADTLDGLRAGLFLVTAQGVIRHANASGMAMLREGSAFRSVTGRLTANDTQASDQLSEACAAAGGGDDTLGARGVAIPLLDRDGVRYVAHVLPLTSGARQSSAKSYSAAAALFVHRAELSAIQPPEALAKAYGLTLTELRVLLGIVQVGSVARTAEELGIAESTVRTHLHRLFGKTGAERQADLVKIVAGFDGHLA